MSAFPLTISLSKGRSPFPANDYFFPIAAAIQSNYYSLAITACLGSVLSMTKDARLVGLF